MTIPVVVSKTSGKHTDYSFDYSPIIAGAVAGFAMAISIYPLDTLKTRLQSPQGFKRAGGFRDIYKGFLTLAVGAMPVNSLFFGSYEATKRLCEPLVAPDHVAFVHMCGASICRGLSSLVRVPVEVAKQRKQVYFGSKPRTALSILLEAYRKEGLRYGVYRGFASIVVRDLPFSFIQMPIWELLKRTVRNYNKEQITSFQSAICGLMAGGIAGALTTPLDLAKTRIMLADTSGVPYDKLRVRAVLSEIYASKGVKGLFTGVTARTSMIMFGGFVFFGTYEETKKYIKKSIGER